MSWANLNLTTQKKVIDKLKQLSVSEVENEELANAFTEASFELELWLNFPHTDLFGEWLEEHEEELKEFSGKTIVVDIEKNQVLASGPPEVFWDGKYHGEYHGPSVFITVIPSEENVSEATAK